MKTQRMVIYKQLTKIMLIAMLILLNKPIYSQIVNGQFLIAGTQDESTSSTIQLADGDYLFCGTTTSYGALGKDLLIVRFNPNFTIQWQKLFGGSGDDYFNNKTEAIENPDGSLIILANTKSSGSMGDADILLMKIDANGANLWSKVYGGTQEERATVIKTTLDGGYIFGGSTDSYNFTNPSTPASTVIERDLFLVKVDNSGTLVWSRTWGTTDNDDAVGGNNSTQVADIVVLTDGTFLVGGIIEGAVDNANSFIAKISSNGNRQWFRRYTYTNGKDGHEVINSLILQDNDNVIITGLTKLGTLSTPADLSNSNGRGMISSYNFTNNTVNWAKVYGYQSSTYNWVFKGLRENVNRYVMNMYENGSGFGNYDISFFAIDNIGNVLQQKVFGTSAFNQSIIFTPTLDNGYLISGITTNSSNDSYLIKMDNLWNTGGCNETTTSIDKQDITITPQNYTSTEVTTINTSTINLSSLAVNVALTTLCATPTCNIVTTDDVTDISCINSIDGSYTVFLDPSTVGVAPFNYTTSTGQSGTINLGGSVTISNIPTGNYWFAITSSDLLNPCSETINIQVEIENLNCCPASIDPQFTQITTPTTYNQNTFWDNKYYIADNVIVTVDGVVLDITNVDVVFGECAGIDFINGGYLRSNNSVYRPCSIDGSWRGLRFDGVGEFDNIINESTFKHAEVALYFQNSADGVVSNNLFSNCNYGVNAENNTDFNHSISGNNFVVDNFYPAFNSCYSFVDNNNVYGISTNHTKMQEISQNQFINSIIKTTPRVYGVHQTKSGGIVSENAFTNIYNAININLPEFTQKISNNEIAINRDISNNSSISLFNSGGTIVEISNNKIITNYYPNNSSAYAIYIDKSTQVSIVGNEITGGAIGIYLLQCTNTQVVENTLDAINNVGIYYYKKWKGQALNYVTCNDITLASVKSSIGIQIEDNSSLHILTNCIKDAGQSIRLLGKGTIPYIRNNYMYNYGSYGIFNDQYTGNIGTSSDPGLNTFWSNNNSAVDIYSNSVIQVADNFGVFNISFPTIQITSNNPFHSTASCGQQIFNMPSQGNLDVNLLCDNYEGIFKPVFSNGSNFFLASNYTEVLRGESNAFEKANMILSSLDNVDNNLLADIILNTVLTTNEQQLLKYLFYARTNNLQEARVHLNLFTPNTLEEIDYKTLAMMQLNITENNYLLSTIDIQYLENLVNQKQAVANYAAYLLRLTPSDPAYIYENYTLTNVADNLEIRKNIDKESYLNVFPNPASSIIYVELVSITPNDQIQLMDVAGKLVENYTSKILSGRIELGIQNLSNGIYFITVTNPSSETTQKGKFLIVK